MQFRTLKVVVFEAYEERGEYILFGSKELAESLAPQLLGYIQNISEALVELSLLEFSEILENGYTWGA